MFCWYNLQFCYFWSQFLIGIRMVIINKQHSVLITQYMIFRTYIPHHLTGNEHKTTSLSKLYACPSYIRYPTTGYNGLSCQRFNIGALQGVIRRGTIYTWSGQFVDEFNYHLCWWLTTTLVESRAYFGLQKKLRSRKIHPRSKYFRPLYL